MSILCVEKEDLPKVGPPARKAAGDSPRAAQPNVARFAGRRVMPCRISARRSPKDSHFLGRSESGNRPNRMRERRHRRADFHADEKGRMRRRLSEKDTARSVEAAGGTGDGDGVVIDTADLSGREALAG